ncbi:hypothetical protein BATR1942_20580 [Bacillus atrophaeus 1942]|uniref:Uncharacterized protein n=1 Tax=Bacillus atrophaeus (strain 1942) TaxID=720555 RepID=A0ABM5M459_BACA1|nr:hypothetical protein BATR1942_20580 [Bacillus atrophaeus 1942]EIM09655.1 hypothetical protein UY9_16036 [Bacillus atrophaeus C89]
MHEAPKRYEFGRQMFVQNTKKRQHERLPFL